MAGGLGCSTLHFADPFFHLFAWLERDDKLLRYEYFVAGSGITGLACSPAFYFENAKISQLDAVVFDECFDDRIEGLLDDFLGLELRQPDLFGDGFDNLFLGHVGIPSESWPLEPSHTNLKVLLMPQV